MSFVVVEGVVGTGKTTATSHFRDALSASCFHFPPAFRIFREQARLDEQVGPWARLAYYLGASLHTGELARAALRSGPVVCDRYAPSPLAMLEAEGLFDEAELRILSEPFLARLVQPTIIVLLTAEHDVARRRVERRKDTLSAVHQRVVASDHFYLAWQESLRRHCNRLGATVELDTSHLTEEELRRELSRVVV